MVESTSVPSRMDLFTTLPWRPHLEVWILVVTMVGAYWWAIRRLSPYYVAGGTSTVRPRQVGAYLTGVGLLWLVSDWPLHDIAEEALISVHMVEHLVLGLVFPALILIGVPRWLWQAMLGPLVPVLRRITHPAVGLVAFNAVFAATHWPPVLAIQNRSEWWHLIAHAVLVASGFLMYWPVLSPLAQIPKLTPFRRIGYLFLNTILPTIPASFLTFTNTFLYPAAYPAPQRLWGLDPVVDQQIAGLLMKLGGGVILWAMMAVIFFRWARAERRHEYSTPGPEAARR